MVADRAGHAGVLVPWANSVVEAELPRWAGRSVTWHYARLVPPSRGTALDQDFLSGLLAATPAALGQLSALLLERVYLACTSAGFMLPGEVVACAAGAAGGVVSAFDAIVTALHQGGMSRIVLLTPYPAAICDAEADAFAGRGITVTDHATLDMADGYSAIEPAQVSGLARRLDPGAVKQAQAVVLSCTGWPTFGLLTALRQDLGKKILSSNQAIALHARRASRKGAS